MSAILESRLDPQRRADCEANDVAMHIPAPTLRAFLVNVGGTREKPRLSFGCMATSSVDAFDEHMDLAEVGERVEIVSCSGQFAISAKRHELAEAQLRQVRA